MEGREGVVGTIHGVAGASFAQVLIECVGLRGRRAVYDFVWRRSHLFLDLCIGEHVLSSGWQQLRYKLSSCVFHSTNITPTPHLSVIRGVLVTKIRSLSSAAYRMPQIYLLLAAALKTV